MIEFLNVDDLVILGKSWKDDTLEFDQRWSVGPMCKERNDHQPPGSSYVSDTVQFNHEWHTCY